MQASRVPKHQNRFKWQHNPKSKKTQKIAELPVEGLCEKCTKLMEWKKDYRKYKPMTHPKKCVNCQQKRVVRSYHILCAVCAQKDGVCGKCRQPCEYTKPFDADKKDAAEKLEFETRLKAMKERERRAVLRETKAQQESSDESDESDLDEATRERRKKGKVKTGVEKKEWNYEGYKEDTSDDGEEDTSSEDDEGEDGKAKEKQDKHEDGEVESNDEDDGDEDDWLAEAGKSEQEDTDGSEKEASKESFDEASDSEEEALRKEQIAVTPKPAATVKLPVATGNSAYVATAETLSGVVKGFTFGK